MRVKWFSPGAGSNKKLKGSLDPSVACSRARLFGRDDSKQVKAAGVDIAPKPRDCRSHAQFFFFVPTKLAFVPALSRRG
jgi:hypothetical protein